MRSCELLVLAVVALGYLVSSSVQSEVKRYPCKTKKKCSKQGGTCVNLMRGDLCYSAVGVDSLCKGGSCTCCLSGKSSCKINPTCQFQGGVCVDSKKAKGYCADGTIDKKGCKGKKCVCCISEEKSCMCGITNKPLPTTTTVAPTTTTKPPTDPPKFPLFPKSTRVAGGMEVDPLDKFPWLVGVKSTDFPSLGYICTGSIINTHYVVTSASCVNSWALTRETTKVGIADFNQNSTDDDIPGVTSLVAVKDIFVHDNPGGLFFDNDIALLRLKNPLDLISYDQIKPVCLPVDDSDDYEGEEAVVAGWGSKNFSINIFVPEATPDEATLTIYDSDCDGNDFIGPVEITSNMLCAAAEGADTSPCPRDTGAPLVVESEGRHVLVGVAIYGSCGGFPDPDDVSVYTRVTKYVKWISKTIGQDGSFCG